MKIYAECIIADVPTKYGRIYPLDELTKAVKEFNEIGLGSGIPAECRKDDPDEFNLEDISHDTTVVEMRGPALYIECVVLPTPMGKNVMERIAEPWRPSPVMLGVLTETAEPDIFTVSDLEIRRVDIAPEETAVA